MGALFLARAFGPMRMFGMGVDGVVMMVVMIVAVIVPMPVPVIMPVIMRMVMMMILPGLQAADPGAERVT